MAVLFPRWDVETGTLAEHFNVDVGGHNTISTTRAHSGTKSIRYSSLVGSDTLTCSFPTNPTTVFAEWWWYLETTVETGIGSGNHCFRFCQAGGGNNQQREVDCFPKNGQLRIDILDHVTGFDSFGQLHDITALPSGQWFKIQILVTLPPGAAATGVVKVWINGVQTFSKTNQQFNNGAGWVRFDIWELTTNWDSGTALWYMDDVYASDVDESGGGGDTTPPVLTNPNDGTPNSIGTIGASVDTDDGTGLLYSCAVTNGSTPTSDQIIAQSGGGIVPLSSYIQSVLAIGTQTIPPITVLNSSTLHQLKFLQVDPVGNRSTISSVDLLTTAFVAPLVIWYDSFEADLLAQYYEKNGPIGADTFIFQRSTSAAFAGAWGMRFVAQTGATSTSNLWLGFGKLPVPGGGVSAWPNFFNATNTQPTRRFKDISVTFRFRVNFWPATTTAIKMLRISVFSGFKTGDYDGGAQAAALHLWSAEGSSSNNEIQMLDPTSGVVGSTVTTQGWNDLSAPPSLGGHGLEFLGKLVGTTHIYSSANIGRWFLMKVRVALNTPGNADGIMEYWVDGVREINRTTLNWVGNFTAFGWNTVHLERYFNAGAPGLSATDFDDLTITDNETSQGIVSLPSILPRSFYVMP